MQQLMVCLLKSKKPVELKVINLMLLVSWVMIKASQTELLEV